MKKNWEKEVNNEESFETRELTAEELENVKSGVSDDFIALQNYIASSSSIKKLEELRTKITPTGRKR